MKKQLFPVATVLLATVAGAASTNQDLARGATRGPGAGRDRYVDVGG